MATYLRIKYYETKLAFHYKIIFVADCLLMCRKAFISSIAGVYCLRMSLAYQPEAASTLRH